MGFLSVSRRGYIVGWVSNRLLLLFYMSVVKKWACLLLIHLQNNISCSSYQCYFILALKMYATVVSVEVDIVVVVVLIVVVVLLLLIYICDFSSCCCGSVTV